MNKNTETSELWAIFNSNFNDPENWFRQYESFKILLVYGSLFLIK